jgi:formylglycine-generating enzyme required for sulfatase activity
VCVPGGAFWYGDLSLYDSAFERLVVVSPFFVDKTEVTVGAYRASGLEAGGDPAPADATHPYCTYTSGAGANEALPVNCVTAVRATPFCAAHGRHLPTEVELAYLAGGMHAHKYVWGKDDPACGDGVFERTTRRNASLYATCKDRGVGVAPPGTGARDRLDFPDGTVVDVFGNLTELTRDAWQTMDEPCWTAPVLVDPYCDKPGKDGFPLTAHGANWESVFTAGNAAVRFTFQSTTGFSRDEDTGFRCAHE